jgi:hypothetical protein
MLRLWLRIVLFLSSYSFLFVILMVQNWESLRILLVLGSIIILANTILFFVLWKLQKKRDTYLQIKTANNRSWENVGYIFTYVIPFLSTDLSSPKDIIALALLFLVIGFFYATTSMIHINPTLNLLGYRIYIITTKDEQEIVLISKKSIKELRTTKVYEVAEGIFTG